MHVYAYLCVHVCAWVCMYSHTHICIYVGMYVCMLCMYVYTYGQTRNVFVPMYVQRHELLPRRARERPHDGGNKYLTGSVNETPICKNEMGMAQGVWSGCRALAARHDHPVLVFHSIASASRETTGNQFQSPGAISIYSASHSNCPSLARLAYQVARSWPCLVMHVYAQQVNIPTWMHHA